MEFLSHITLKLLIRIAYLINLTLESVLNLHHLLHHLKPFSLESRLHKHFSLSFGRLGLLPDIVMILIIQL